MKTIKDAYEELDGDLNNTISPRNTDSRLYFDTDDGEYICLSHNSSSLYLQYICSIYCTGENSVGQSVCF